MDLDLKGKRAVVCGSTQGIGKASAVELASLGASVTLMARDEKRLKSTLEELDATAGQQHNYLLADFSFPEQVKKAIRGFVAKDDVHILVNNTAGPPAGAAIDAFPEDFIYAFTAHLICNQIMVQAVVPSMTKNSYGRIINII
jgi:3-oxoacyl-[acyl-carrier protein] reductase